MAAACDVKDLCETWWAKVADSSKGEQHSFASSFLRLLGWDAPESLSPKSNWRAFSGASYVLRAGAETDVAAHFAMPGVLEPPSSLIERGLDFCRATRLLVNGTRALNVQYAFITDLFRSYLYDVHGDVLLIHADSPNAFDHSFRDILNKSAVERDSLKEVRRPPRSHSARQLREWRQHWFEELSSTPGSSERLAELLIDRILLLGYLANHNVLKLGGRNYVEKLGAIIEHAFASESAGCGEMFTRLCDKLWKEWRVPLFSPNASFTRLVSADDIAAPLLKEFALLSRAKFTIATVLESFNYGEPAEKARVRMVPDTNKERETYLAKQTPETIDRTQISLDIHEEGYRAIHHWFDKLIALYDRLETEYDARDAQTPPAENLDLFTWAEMAAARPRAFVDKYNYAAQRGLAVYCGSQRQLRLSRLMLTMYLISRYHENRRAFTRFPDLSYTFQPRACAPDLEDGEGNSPARETSFG